MISARLRSLHRNGRWPIALLLALVATAICAGIEAEQASAAPPSVWRVDVVAQPTSFVVGGEHDEYTLLISNRSVTASAGTVTVKDQLPPGVTLAAPVEAVDRKWTCHGETGESHVECITEASIEGQGAPSAIAVPVAVSGAAATPVQNTATVEGGGGQAAATTVATPTGGPPTPFGADGFSFAVLDESGAPELLAGAHPSAVAVSFTLATITNVASGLLVRTPEEPRSVSVELPAGLVGYPLATPTCPVRSLVFGPHESRCPRASKVGEILYRIDGNEEQEPSGIYNMTPEAGYPVVYGFNFSNQPVLMYASVGPAPGYGVHITVPGLPDIGFQGASMVFYGDPAARTGEATSPSALFTNPTVCTQAPLTATLSVDSWGRPGQFVTRQATAYPSIEGCERLSFSPTFSLAPETTSLDSPSGADVALRVPQSANLAPNLATPSLREARVTLPAGMGVSPPAAEGLAGCPETGPHGFNLEGAEASELGEGERDGSVWDDAQLHSAPGHCPANAQVGTVEVITPLLASPLQGHLYLAAPRCGGAGQQPCTNADALDGKLFSLDLEAQGAGVVIKLAGHASANPETGQLTVTFAGAPQLPFGELRVHLTGGPRAPLANPQSCGPATTSTLLTPWGGEPATPTSTFLVDGDGHGGACPSASALAPTLEAGTLRARAAEYSPLSLSFARRDGEGDISTLTSALPPGLLANIASVPRCASAQAQAGACPASSEIGEATVGAGAGSHPYYVQGRVYLTDSYRGAPFGLSVVVPAVAGPFNLGNVNVRVALYVDPTDAHVTAVSDPLPQILDGVQLRLKAIRVLLNRPGFTFNATSCAAQRIGASITSAAGATGTASSPYSAAECHALPFAPALSASTAAVATKANGASVRVRLAYPGAKQANLAGAVITFPQQLSVRLTTLQKACPAAVFEANPASCPAASIIGQASVRTPILASPLAGPTYLVSHGSAKFPDVVFLLQGEGVTLRIDGQSHVSAGGVLTVTFSRLPDAPFSVFETTLPTGAYSQFTSALPFRGGAVNQCGEVLVAPTTLTGQNGAQLSTNTPVSVSGCGTAPTLKLLGAHLDARRHREIISVRVNHAGRLIVTGAALARTVSRALSAGTHTILIPLKATALAHGPRTSTVALRFAVGRQYAGRRVQVRL